MTCLWWHDKITESLKKNSLRSLILSKKTSKKFLTNNKRQVMINELLKDFKKRNRKKLLKKSWQSLAALVWYKSCYGSQNKSEKHFRWSRPLKTEQSKTNQMCRASWFNSRQQTFLTSKQYASKQIELNNRKIVRTFYESLILAQDERWRRA